MAAAAAASAKRSRKGSGRRPAARLRILDQYTVNLTENARKGKIDPVLARDFEIRQVVDILTRRRQNNPILVGEAGVGKTAVVEGFALRVAQGDVPEPLEERARPHPRPGAAAGGRRRQRRIREPAQGSDQRGEVFAQRPSSCSSTKPTP